MGIYKNSAPFGSIVTDGLVLNLDATNINSYPGTGTTWTDTSISKINGTLTNGPTFLQERGRGSIVFDGVDDYVISQINLAYSQGTISCWIYPKATGKNFFVYTANNPSLTFTHQLGINGSSQLSAYIYDSGAVGSRSFTGSTLSLNRWYNVVFYWINNNSYGSYLNGVFDNSGTLVTAWTAGSNFWIGSSAGGPVGVNGYFNGNISNLQIYNRSLTSQQILQNYNALKGRFIN